MVSGRRREHRDVVTDVTVAATSDEAAVRRRVIIGVGAVKLGMVPMPEPPAKMAKTVAEIIMRRRLRRRPRFQQRLRRQARGGALPAAMARAEVLLVVVGEQRTRQSLLSNSRQLLHLPQRQLLQRPGLRQRQPQERGHGMRVEECRGQRGRRQGQRSNRPRNRGSAKQLQPRPRPSSSNNNNNNRRRSNSNNKHRAGRNNKNKGSPRVRAARRAANPDPLPLPQTQMPMPLRGPLLQQIIKLKLQRLLHQLRRAGARRHLATASQLTHGVTRRPTVVRPLGASPQRDLHGVLRRLPPLPQQRLRPQRVLLRLARVPRPSPPSRLRARLWTLLPSPRQPRLLRLSLSERLRLDW